MTRQKPRVLLVDDQPDTLDLLTAVLHPECELLAATNATSALELAPGADLVLLDIRMPGMNGFELCHRLRVLEATRNTPVIFVTGLADPEQEARGFEMGGVDYITKPINPAIVRARVHTHLALKAARDQLEELATSDALTGIANRRRFDGALQEEWRRLARASRSLTIAIADIDDFKRFNDLHGHAGGDACLRAVAQDMAALCRRPGELVARYGGEEFAFLLPEVDAKDARLFVMRTLRAVAGLAVPGVALRGGTGLSVGAATLIPYVTRSPQDVVRAADEQLYLAKRNGKGRGATVDLETGAFFEVLPE